MSQEKKKGQEEPVNNQSVAEPELETPSEEPENQETEQSKTDSADETDNLAAEVEELKKKIEK